MSEAREKAAPAMLSPEGLLERWAGAVTEKTLRNWRSAGTGPGWTTIGRRVRYPIEAVEAFESRHRSIGRGGDEAPATEASGTPT